MSLSNMLWSVALLAVITVGLSWVFNWNVLLGAGVFFTGSGALFLYHLQRVARTWSAAKGTVVSISRAEHTTATFRYEHEGVTRMGETASETLRQDQSIDVFVNPDNPDEAVVKSSFVTVLAAVVLFVGLAMMIYATNPVAQ